MICLWFEPLTLEGNGLELNLFHLAHPSKIFCKRLHKPPDSGQDIHKNQRITKSRRDL